MNTSDFFPFGELRSYIDDELIDAATAEQLRQSREAADDGQGVIEVRVWCLRDNGTRRYTLDEPVSPPHVDNDCDCFDCNATEVDRVDVLAYVVGE